MRPYQSYSFEELRFCNPSQNKVSEVLFAADLGDYTYGSIWTPNTIGHFSLSITIDGVTLEEVYRTEVKETGIPPPPQKISLEKSQPQNKLRRFRAANSAGLRIRSHPTLQSEQVGIIKMDGIISFIDEVCTETRKSNIFAILLIKTKLYLFALQKKKRLKTTMAIG